MSAEPAAKTPFEKWQNTIGYQSLTAFSLDGDAPVEDLESRLASAFSAGAASEREKLEIAFVQGAKWWEYNRTGGTMWASDRRLSEKEARIRSRNGELGETNKFT